MTRAANTPRRRKNRRLGFEPLESRELLSRALPLPPVPPNVRSIVVNRAAYRIEISGPGVLRVQPAGRGQVGITLFGTTEQSTLNVTRTRVGAHWVDSGLPVGKINVKSGLLGGIQARGTADLLGTITPIQNSVGTLQFRDIGPKAVINIGGNLGSLDAGEIDLGPGGLIHVQRALTGTVDVTNAIDIDGGLILVDQGPIGAIKANSLRLTDNGRVATTGSLGPVTVTTDLKLDSGEIIAFQGPISGISANSLYLTNAGRITSGGALGPVKVTQNLVLDTSGNLNAGTTLAGITVGQDLVIRPTGRIDVGTNSTAPIQVGRDLILDGGPILIQGDLVGGLSVGRDATFTEGGQLVVVRDLSGPLTIGNNLTLDDGNLLIGRDITATATVGGDLVLAHGGQFSVGRNVGDGLVIEGDFNSSQVGSVQVGGNLNGLTITGAFIGQGGFGTGTPDLSVGLDLNDLTVLGAVPNEGSISNATIIVGKNLVGIDVRHGIFNSFISVGVLIDGGETTPSGGNVGPDATSAIFDSEVRAGLQIRNLLISGDVVSDQVTNPNGHMTRIIAGIDRAGIVSSAGNVENFQITGRLIDSVIVASVAPSGGNGTLDPTAPPTLSVGNYDAPAGTLAAGSIGAVFAIPHFAPGSYDEFGQLVGYFYDPVLSPVPDDLIMFGAINASFAPTPLPPSPPPANGTAIPLPSKSTVLGGVIDTAPPGNAYDHAGLFAADTRGVFVGTLPPS